MLMIQLKSKTVCDGFKVDKKLYKNRISASDAKQIEYIESLISSKDKQFLQDPQFWIDRWENLTGEDLPYCYTVGIPCEITGSVASPRRKAYFLTHFLPVLDHNGLEIQYPSKRKVQAMENTYILDDSLISELVAA